MLRFTDNMASTYRKQDKFRNIMNIIDWVRDQKEIPQGTGLLNRITQAGCETKTIRIGERHNHRSI